MMRIAEALEAFRPHRGDALVVPGRGGRYWVEHSTLMSADSRCRRVNSWLSCERLFRAHPGKAGGAVVETTVDHTLMRGLEPHDR